MANFNEASARTLELLQQAFDSYRDLNTDGVGRPTSGLGIHDVRVDQNGVLRGHMRTTITGSSMQSSDAGRSNISAIRMEFDVVRVPCEVHPGADRVEFRYGDPVIEMGTRTQLAPADTANKARFDANRTIQSLLGGSTGYGVSVEIPNAAIERLHTERTGILQQAMRTVDDVFASFARPSSPEAAAMAEELKAAQRGLFIERLPYSSELSSLVPRSSQYPGSQSLQFELSGGQIKVNTSHATQGEIDTFVKRANAVGFNFTSDKYGINNLNVSDVSPEAFERLAQRGGREGQRYLAAVDAINKPAVVVAQEAPIPAPHAPTAPEPAAAPVAEAHLAPEMRASASAPTGLGVEGTPRLGQGFALGRASAPVQVTESVRPPAMPTALGLNGPAVGQGAGLVTPVPAAQRAATALIEQFEQRNDGLVELRGQNGQRTYAFTGTADEMAKLKDTLKAAGITTAPAKIHANHVLVIEVESVAKFEKLAGPLLSDVTVVPAENLTPVSSSPPPVHHHTDTPEYKVQALSSALEEKGVKFAFITPNVDANGHVVSYGIRVSETFGRGEMADALGIKDAALFRSDLSGSCDDPYSGTCCRSVGDHVARARSRWASRCDGRNARDYAGAAVDPAKRIGGWEQFSRNLS